MMQFPRPDLLAVILFNFPPFHTFGAAVAAIIITSFVVVVVVAIAVSFVLFLAASQLALILRVETLALQIKHPFRTNDYTRQD